MNQTATVQGNPIDKPYALRGFFVIWVEDYNPEGGSFRLSPHGATAHDGWAVSNSRYCSRDNWKTIRRFATWDEVLEYTTSKTKNGKCPFEPMYVLESKYSKYVCPVSSRDEAVEVDMADLERERARLEAGKKNMELARQSIGRKRA